MSKIQRERISDLFSFLDRSITPFHAAVEIENRLSAAAYPKLDLRKLRSDELREHQRAQFSFNQQAVFAYRRGSQGLRAGLRIFVAHNDSPALQIKACPMQAVEDYYLAETSIYGGPILQSYFDLPLGVAGRVFYRDNAGKIANQLIQLSAP
ncbi:MAG: hypothetical protein Q4P72_05420, partial [Eubacteriales bacterium]|nr:hypothetical protein [Eubacteriales bacterium]